MTYARPLAALAAGLILSTGATVLADTQATSTEPPYYKFLDLGLTAAVLGGLGAIIGRWILPRYWQQQDAVLAAYRDEALRSAARQDALVAQLREMQTREQAATAALLATITTEWRATREQLHTDAERFRTALERLHNHNHADHPPGP